MVARGMPTRQQPGTVVSCTILYSTLTAAR